ncbi:MAG: hypothetical protein HZA21_02065, partial [Nitrospirae bacterium]|nr:hypothetical protein [Nitrospirota bacterium]
MQLAPFIRPIGGLLRSIFFCIGLTLWAAAAWSQPADIEKEVADYDRQIQQKRDFLTGKEQNKKQIEAEVLKTEAALTDTQRRLQPLTAELETLKVKTQKAKKMLDAADANPELIDPAKLEALRKDYHQAQVRQNQVEEERDKTTKQAEGLTKRLDEVKAQKQVADREVDQVNLEILNLTLKKPVTVEGVGECLMHETITVAACKETAMLKAKQDAVEKGGKSLIRSLSEVSLFELKKDEIRAEANVQIRHLDILQPPQR